MRRLAFAFALHLAVAVLRLRYAIDIGPAEHLAEILKDPLRNS